jgi:GntR family transcriptional regulator of arabinose operon
MEGKKPLYRVIYEDLASRIQSGRLKQGDRIPTEKEWAVSYGVSRITSKKALDLAAEHGMIDRKPGKGSFVTREARMISGRSSRGRQRTIGVVLPELSDFFGLDLFTALEQCAHENGYHILTGISNKRVEKENDLILRFRDYPVDAMIVFPVHKETFNNEMLKLIISRFPIILVDRYLRDVSVPNVLTRNRGATMLGMEHLYELGHRAIGVVSRPLATSTSLQEREKGILESLAKHGERSHPEWWLTELEELDDKSETRFLAHQSMIRRFLSDHPELTAVFSLEYSAIPMLRSVAEELGLRVPEDLSLICFDSPGHVTSHLFPVTHLRQNQRGIACKAFELVRRMLDGEALTDYRFEVDAELIIGSTTGPIRG